MLTMCIYITAHCGGTVYASTIPTQISSPNYDSGTYENGQECNWLIKVGNWRSRYHLNRIMFQNFDSFY